MPDQLDGDPMGPGPHEIIFNINRGRYELRSFGSSEAIISAETATEVAQVAEDASLNVRMVAGRPVMMNEDSLTAAREVDLAARGITPPPTASSTHDPGEHVELDRLAADLETAAVVDGTPAPSLPDEDTLKREKLYAATDEWMKAYEAQQQLMAEMDERLAAGEPIASLADEIQQLRVVNEALEAATEKVAGAGMDDAWEAELRSQPPEDPPEAELVDKPGPKPSSGPSAEALDEPVLADHSEPAIPMPTEHVTTGTDRSQELREESQTRYENRIANGMTPQDAANYELAQQAAIERGSFHPPGSSMWNLDIQHQTRVNLRLMAQHQEAALDVVEAGRRLEPVKGAVKKERLGKVLKRGPK